MKSTLAASAIAVVVAVVGSTCTSDEQIVLADPQDVGNKANDCGASSYNILTGNFNHDKFNNCFSASAGISKTCAECYAATGEYGTQNCKAECLLGWCKSGCLSCTEPAQKILATCAGFSSGAAEPCADTVKDATGNSIAAMLDRCSLCTDDDDDGCGGCTSQEMPADDIVLGLFSAHVKIQSQAQERALQEGINGAFAEFVPIRYATQVVAGRNWFVKVQLGSDQFADVAIFEPLAFRGESPEIFNIKFGVDRDAPISVIPTLSSGKSIAAMLDRCSLCADNDNDDCDGCPSHEKPADDSVLGLFSGAEFHSQAQQMATQQGRNAAFPEFSPIRYATQVVAGTNWFVKVQLDSGMYADVEIFEPLVFRHQAPYISSIKFGVDRNAPISLISYVLNEAAMINNDVDDEDGHGNHGEEKLADDAVLRLFSAHVEIQSQAREKALQEGINGVLPEFVPIRYATQVVAGRNWFVKVQLDSDKFADVAIFEPLAFRHQAPEIFDIKFNVERDAPISFLSNKVVMV